jgi:hypothetical protein
VAAGAWIHVNEAERLVAHYFQDVGMTADEQTRTKPPDLLSCTPVVIARITPDVRHVNTDALAIPKEILRNFSTEFCAVDIPVNAPGRPEGLEPIQNLDLPEVTRMPNLIAFGEVQENRVVEKSVGVGEQPDSQFPAYPPPNVPPDSSGDHRMKRNGTAPR